MSRHPLQRFAIWAAFAVALLFTSLFSRSARAAILPLCEVETATRMPWAPSLPPFAFVAAEEPTPPCDELSTAEDESDIDPGIAAFSDERGASAVAPQRILPIDDARIDAAPGCLRLDLSIQTIAASPHDGLVTGSSALLIDPAKLDADTMIPPAASELLPDYAPVADVECSGVERSVYHPPR